MLPLCDYVTIHVPANEATKGMFNAELFAAMKDGAVVLNFSRDKLVKDADLLAALESGKISQYVTDFPNDALVGKAGVVLLPHLGASTEEAEDNCAVMAVQEIRDYLENGNIVNSCTCAIQPRLVPYKPGLLTVMGASRGFPTGASGGKTGRTGKSSRRRR